ncbi:hypothetical protein ACFL35_21475 [Candidatus Riflebacteria bacterium]
MQNKKGTVLFATFFFILIIGVLVIHSFFISTQFSTASANLLELERARYQARSGLEYAVNRLETLGTGTFPLSINRNTAAGPVTIDLDFDEPHLYATATLGLTTAFVTGLYYDHESEEIHVWTVGTYIAKTGTSTNGPIGTATVKKPGFILVNSAGNFMFQDMDLLREVQAGTVYTRIDSLDQIKYMESIAGLNVDYPAAFLGGRYRDDGMNHGILKLNNAATIVNYVGNAGGYADGSFSNAQFKFILDVAIDADGNLYLADSTNNVVRKVTSNKALTLHDFDKKKPVSVAISPTTGDLHILTSEKYYVSSGGVLSEIFSLRSGLHQPIKVRCAANGDIYYASKIHIGIIVGGNNYLLAGTETGAGYQDGIAEEAKFSGIIDFGVAISGNNITIYVCDSNGIRVVKNY